MTGVWQDIRYGLRMLGRNPVFTAVAVLTLALGFGANTAIFSVVSAVLLRPLPFNNAERLVWAWGRMPGVDHGAVAPADFLDYRAQNHTFEELGAIGAGAQLFNLAGTDKPELVKGGMATAGFFEALGVQPLYGRLFTQADEQVTAPEVVVLGHSLWKERFGGDPTIIGKLLKIDGRGRTVIGLLRADLPLFSEEKLWIPTPYLNEGMKSRRSHFLRLVALLKPGVSLFQAQADLDTITARIGRDYPNDVPNGWSMGLVPLKSALVGDARAALLILLGAVALVLLIACTNVANILLARNTTRRHEIAIRIALGAGKWQILRQMLTESVLLSFVGGLTGVFLAGNAVSLFRSLGPRYIPRLDEVSLSGPVLAFTAGIALLTGLLFGLGPALTLSRLGSAGHLKEGGIADSRSKHRAHMSLVITEVSLSFVVLIAAGLVLNSFWRVIHVNPGFDSANVMTAQISLVLEKYKPVQRRVTFFEQLREGIKALPGVEAAGFVSELPMSGQADDTYFTIREHPLADPKATQLADVRIVSGDYFRAMHIPVLWGRSFTLGDTAESAKVVLVNDAFAKQYFPGENAIGKHLQIYEGKPEFTAREIVGVVGGNKHFALQEPMRPQMFTPYAQSPFPNMNLVVRTSADPMSLAPALRETLRTLDADEALSAFRLMDEVISSSASGDRLNAWLLGIFGAIALALAAGGIFGVLSYLVTQRTREIGVRMALGARPEDVLQMVVGYGMRLTLAGLVIGAAGALAATRWMATLLYDIKPADPLTYLMVGMLLVLVALVACWIPARRATKVDPMVALRYE